VKKLNHKNSYQINNFEKSPNNNLNINEKNSPIYSKYDSGKSYYQDNIEENKKDNENKMMIQRHTYTSLQNNNNFNTHSNDHLLEQPNLKIYKKIKNPKPRKAILIEDFHTFKENAKKDSNISEYKNFNVELTNEKLQTKIKNINDNNNIKKVNSKIIQSTDYKNNYSHKKITPLKNKAQAETHYYTSKVEPIKPEILFNDEKQINNNYQLTKNESLSCHKNKLVVMKIIRTNLKREHLSFSSNELKFNQTNNSIKDNKNFLNNTKKIKKINLKQNKNNKLSGYIYNPLDFLLNTKINENNENIPSKKTHKNSDYNNKDDNNNNFGLSQNLFKKE
jgi:hypothetical protein